MPLEPRLSTGSNQSFDIENWNALVPTRYQLFRVSEGEWEWKMSGAFFYDSVEDMFKAMMDWALIYKGIHPYPCPSCGTQSLEKDSWICKECGRDRTPKQPVREEDGKA